MEKTIFFTSKAPAPVGPYSQAIKAGNFLFVSGQIPLDPQTGKVVQNSFEAQCRRVLDNLKSIVDEAGSSLEKVVKVNIYLIDLGKFSQLNAIYSEYFGQSKPARACVQVARLPLDVEVEIEAVAMLD
ncbi:MAG: RidA family protein [Candidatus Brocadiae bacterium]|nr:RidA family protein [Candidatus Brocadiia bacterium]